MKITDAMIQAGLDGAAERALGLKPETVKHILERALAAQIKSEDRSNA